MKSMQDIKLEVRAALRDTDDPHLDTPLAVLQVLFFFQLINSPRPFRSEIFEVLPESLACQDDSRRAGNDGGGVRGTPRD